MALLKINGENVTNYNMQVTRYREQLLTPPAIKPIVVNDWYEGGVDFGLDKGVQFENSRRVTLEFYSRQFRESSADFIDYLKENETNSFEFDELDRTYNLRIAEILKPKIIGDIDVGVLPITFIEDNFTLGSAAPSFQPIIVSNLAIDGEDLNKFGFHYVENNAEFIERNVLHDRLQGATEDFHSKIKAVKFRIKCMMPMEAFMGNYEYFLRFIMRRNARLIDLKIGDDLYSYEGYLTGIKANRVHFEKLTDNSVVAGDFDINFNVIEV